MVIEVSFPGGNAVDAAMKGHVLHTDQGPGEIAPFDLFLASIATCAGFYALEFCRQRAIDTGGLGVSMSVERGQSRVERVRVDLRLPPDFPEKYRGAIVRAVDQCAVKKAIEDPPRFEVAVAEAAPA